MKAIIIVPGLIRYLPYISLYEELLKKQNVDYEILQWDRTDETDQEYNNIFKNGYAFSNSMFKRFISYFHYINWVYFKIKECSPDLIIVATIAPAICLMPILYKWKGKFIFDIRDYSPLVKLFNPLIDKIVTWSCYTLISSKGFLEWLPKRDYLAIYNLGIKVEPSINLSKYNPIKVATIGYLRDFEENALMIDSLGNKAGVELIFHGDGLVLSKLIDYSKTKKYKNIKFTGGFNKEEEAKLYANADIINILMPSGLAGSTLMSNRFVNAVSYQRPVIVSENSYQAKLVKDYDLGFSIGKNDDVYITLKKYIESFNPIEFSNRCFSYMSEIIKEQNAAKQKIESLIIKLRIQ